MGVNIATLCPFHLPWLLAIGKAPGVLEPMYALFLVRTQQFLS
jgi:hypothetical protein